jgi:hypothetical protein
MNPTLGQSCTYSPQESFCARKASLDPAYEPGKKGDILRQEQNTEGYEYPRGKYGDHQRYHSEQNQKGA